MKNILFLFIFLALLSSFTNSKKSIVGFYSTKCDGFNCTQLEIKKDSTFSYYSFYDAGGSFLKTGFWRVKKDTLLLTTFAQSKVKFGYKILDSTINETKKIYLFDLDSFSLFQNLLIINYLDTIFNNFNDSGYLAYHSDIADLQIINDDFYFHFKIKEKNYSKIAIFIDDFACYSGPKHYNNEKFIIRNNQIFPFCYCSDTFCEQGLTRASIREKKF